jgi:subtilisin family serine protease
MIVRVLDSADQGTVANVALGVDYAVVHGARVINMSLNGAGSTAALDAAIEDARVAGVLVVVSAGNDGADLGLTPSFPACSTSPDVVTVASVGRSGTLSAFSDHGSCVDVTAPGENILSTAMGGGYELRDGTSTSAPQVAGVAALALALDPAVPLGELVSGLESAPRTGREAVGQPPHLDAWGVLRVLG